MLNRSLQTTIVIFSVTLVTLLTGVSRAGDRGPSYSTDHWPNRWSSAIRQQQAGHYPSRNHGNMPPPELPVTQIGGELSETDLFYAPGRQGMKEQYYQNNMYNNTGFHRRGSMHGKARRAAFAYHGLPPMNPVYGLPANTINQIAIDPVLGHPGMGIPIMPGTPYGYPFIGYSPLYQPAGFMPGANQGFTPAYPLMRYW